MPIKPNGIGDIVPGPSPTPLPKPVPLKLDQLRSSDTVTPTVTARVDKLTLSGLHIDIPIPGVPPIVIDALPIDLPFKMEAGYFTSGELHRKLRVLFTTKFPQAPSVTVAGELRLGKVEIVKFEPKKYTLPAIPKIDWKLPELPKLEPIKLPEVKLPTLQWPKLDTLFVLQDQDWHDNKWWDNWEEAKYQAYLNSFWPSWVWDVPPFSNVRDYFARRQAQSDRQTWQTSWNKFIGPIKDTYNKLQTNLDKIINGESDGAGGFKEGSLAWLIWKIHAGLKDTKNAMDKATKDLKTSIEGTETSPGKYSGGINGAIQDVTSQFENWKKQIETLPSNINDQAGTMLSNMTDGLNRSSIDNTSALNSSINALYKMAGVPDGILTTPINVEKAEIGYFDIVATPKTKYWYIAIAGMSGGAVV